MSRSLSKNRQFVYGMQRALGHRAKQVLDYVMEHPDARQVDIAEALDISPQRVSQIMQSIRYDESVVEAAKKAVGHMVPMAIKTNKDLLAQRENLEVARKVAERVLTDKKVLDAPEVKHTHSLSSASLDELKQIVGRVDALPSPCIDAEIVEDSNPTPSEG